MAHPFTPVPRLAAEFRARPLGHHSPELQRLLRRFRTLPVEGKHGLLRVDHRREWVLIRFSGLSRAAAAERLGVSKAYVEHAFRDHPQYAVEVAA